MYIYIYILYTYLLIFLTSTYCYFDKCISTRDKGLVLKFRYEMTTKAKALINFAEC